MKWKDKTRGGHPVRIYAEDGGGSCPIHGAIGDGGGFRIAIWDSNGRHNSGLSNIFDLIPATPIIDWSKQPDWCKAVAKSSGGLWWRFDEVPDSSEFGWDQTGAFVQRAHPSEYLAFDGDWKDSLCVRPEGGAQ